MNQLQAKLHELLIDIDRICSKHDITYYLAAGGALGAIRHGGFLPWDDDLDVYITRDNWERFKQIIGDELPPNRTFICEENNELYCNSVGRYVDKDSTLMMPSHLLCGECCGLQIEFFVMDPFPVDSEERLEHQKYLKVYTELLLPYFVLNKNIFSRNKDFDYKLYNKYYVKSKVLGRERVLTELKQKVTSFSESECEDYCMRWGQKTWIFPKHAFGEPRMEMFEGREFPVVKKSEVIFRIGYGDDWMYVPTKEYQISHDLSNDIHEPFKTYVDIYMPLIDKEKLLKSYNKRKRVDMKSLITKERYERDIAVLRAEVCAKIIAARGYEMGELEELLDKKDFDKLDDLFSQFYSTQGNSFIRDNMILIPVADDYLYVAIMNKIMQGSYYAGAKLLSLRENEREPLTQKLKKAKKLIEFCRALSIAIYDEKDAVRVEHILRDNENYREYIDYKRAELWYMYCHAESNDEYVSLLNKAKEFSDDFPNDGEIMRFQAYALYKLGEEKASEDMYKSAVANTRNGFVWREAKELFGIDGNDR